MDRLKSAERQASSLVEAARKEKVERMKEAKAEAAREIAAYRNQLEASYQAKSSAVILFACYGKFIFGFYSHVLFFLKCIQRQGAKDSEGSKLSRETSDSISKFQSEFQRNNEKVEALLINLVMTVDKRAPAAKK